MPPGNPGGWTADKSPCEGERDQRIGLSNAVVESLRAAAYLPGCRGWRSGRHVEHPDDVDFLHPKRPLPARRISLEPACPGARAAAHVPSRRWSRSRIIVFRGDGGSHAQRDGSARCCRCVRGMAACRGWTATRSDSGGRATAAGRPIRRRWWLHSTSSLEKHLLVEFRNYDRDGGLMSYA